MAFDTHKKIDALTKEQFSAIKSGVLKHHKCVDEYMLEIIENVFK